jgi:plastocyanin
MTQGLELPTVADHTPGRPTAISKPERNRASALLRGGAVSRKLTRVLLVASLAVGISAPMLSVYAAPRSPSVDAYDPPKGFVPPGKAQYQPLEVSKGDTVSWVIWEGEHTITPKAQWPDQGSGQDNLTMNSPRYTTKPFNTVGDFVYYCKVHGGLDKDGNPTGMWGVVRVSDPNATPPPTDPTTPSTTQTPTSQTTATSAPATTPVTTATAPATGRPAAPSTTAPAPTTTTAKPEKDKKQKEESTTTSSTLPPPVDIPDSAIIPALPGSTGTSSADPGTPGQAPTDVPEGEAIALLKSKKSNGDALKLLIISGIGLGALGFGTAGYKYANRSSKYFPA